jgi:hypothetical protein
MASLKDVVERLCSDWTERWPRNRSVISTHTLKRWKRKVNHLGYLTPSELRLAAEDLRDDMLKVLETLGR